MLKKTSMLFLCQMLYIFSSFGQVTNIVAEHDAANGKYLISYDLAKVNNQRYYDIEITAMIGAVKVRPSMEALTGDVGLNIKHKNNRTITWDYFIDIEKIIGAVSFKIRARSTFIPLPPKPKVDMIIGTAVSSAGIYMATVGFHTILKKGKANPTATPRTDPIRYYYTFCDVDSPNYTPALARINTDNSMSNCDAHFIAANAAYKKGVDKSAIGLALVAGGLYTFLTKPFNKAKLNRYREKYNLTFQPTFNWEQALPDRQGIVGVQMQYQFGR